MKVLIITSVVILVGVGLYYSIKNYLNEEREKDLTVSGKNVKTTSTPRKKSTKK